MKKQLLTLLLVPFLIGCGEVSKYPKWVLNSPWGEEKAETMYDTFHALIPYMEAEEHEFVYSKDEYGQDPSDHNDPPIPDALLYDPVPDLNAVKV